MPNRVLIHASVREYRSHREHYDALVKDLETEGVLVRLLSPGEERGAAWANERGEPYDLVIHAGELAGTILSPSTLIARVRERLRSPGAHGEPRRARLYLADGVERTFTLGGEE